MAIYCKLKIATVYSIDYIEMHSIFMSEDTVEKEEAYDKKLALVTSRKHRDETGVVKYGMGEVWDG